MDYKTAGVRPVVRHVEFNRLPRMTVRRRLVLSVPLPRGPEFRRRKRPAYEMSSAGNRGGRPLAIAVAAMTLWWSAGPGAEAVTDDMLKIACDDMTPRHASYAAENAARTPCPYRLLANATAAVPGRPVRLTLTSPDGSVPFKGFMVQARDARSGRVLGTFLPDCSDGNRTYHMITCPNGGLPFVRRVLNRLGFLFILFFIFYSPRPSDSRVGAPGRGIFSRETGHSVT